MHKKILVVDDDRDIVEIIVQLLQTAGYLVIPSYSAKLINEVVTLKPDLILLDDWLPENSGMDFCRMLKSDPLTAKIPVILFSAHNNIRQNSLDCGADAFIAKPFDIDDLEAMVKKLI